MTVTIDGKQNTFEQELTVQKLSEEAYVELQEYVTVQVNSEILGRESLDSTTICDGDRVESLYYMDGGC